MRRAFKDVGSRAERECSTDRLEVDGTAYMEGKAAAIREGGGRDGHAVSDA